jgi:hypothetical protein
LKANIFIFLSVISISTVLEAKEMELERSTLPSKAGKSCDLIVESIRKVEVGCYYVPDKSSAAVKMTTAVIDDQCRVTAVNKKTKKRYDYYSGKSGCNLKPGEIIKVELAREPSYCPLATFECLKKEDKIVLAPSTNLSALSILCNMNQRGWSDKSLLPDPTKN